MGPVSILLRRPSCRARRANASRGFTLLELLVVLVIAGFLLGMVSFNGLPGERQALRQDAQRIALLLQLARDEAILRNAPVAFEADGQRYRFLIRKDNAWQTLAGDELLRERDFARAPLALTMDPPLAGATLPMRLVLGREAVDKPFVLTLATGDNAVSIRADGIGHYEVD